MVGYVSKDEGKSHFQTHSKNVTRAEIISALAEYRTLQRAVVTEYRTEMGKKNFYGLARRYKQEHLAGLEVSIVQLVTWLIQDGAGVPGHTWICPSGAWPMCPARSQAFTVALMTPALFTRAHCYTLFFSGGQGARVSSSYALWDSMDREYEVMTPAEAKQCSHNRMLLEGRMDQARERAALEKATNLSSLAGFVPRLSKDSSSESEEEETSCTTRRPSRPSLNDMVRTENDLCEASSDLPLMVHPKCVEHGCRRAGTHGMVQCSLCEGDLHRSCGVMANSEDGGAVGFQGRRCTTCAKSKNGKGKSK